MKAERAVFDKVDSNAVAASDARAMADVEAGRVVDHEAVAAWLAKWGTAKEVPMPPEWLA